jgi:hypothetical protein
VATVVALLLLRHGCGAPARSPTNCPAASLRSLQDSSPRKPQSKCLPVNAGLEGLLCPRLRGKTLGEHVADAADLGAYGFQFFFDFFVAAVDVVDAVDYGLAVGY